MRMDDLRAALKDIADAYATSKAKGAKAKAAALNKALAVLSEATVSSVADYITAIQASAKPPAKAKTSAQPKSKKPPLDAHAIGLTLKEARSDRARYEDIMNRLQTANPTVAQLKIVADSYGATLPARKTKQTIYKAIEDRFKIWVQSDSNKSFLENITPW